MRPLEELRLAPLTILIGKNNAGKSTVGRLIFHAVEMLASEGPDPFPMKGLQGSYGSTFRDVIHGRKFFNPVDVGLKLTNDAGLAMEICAQLALENDFDDAAFPSVVMLAIDGTPVVQVAGRSGLLPRSREFDSLRLSANAFLHQACRIQPLRQPFRRIYQVVTRPYPPRFGSDEDVASLLFESAELRRSVSEWMVQNLEDWSIEVAQSLDTFQLETRRGNISVNLADAGQGIQQVLPIVSLCKWRELAAEDAPVAIDVVEQPELHLHDAAHAALGDLLWAAVHGSSRTMVVETHSEALLLRIRRRIAEGVIPHDSVSLYFVENGSSGSSLQPISLLPDGDVGWWPDGVFSESFAEVKAIRKAQRLRRGA